VGSSKGFTLVEVLVALAVLGIVAASFTALFSSSFQGIFAMGTRSDALFVGHQQMERIMAMPSSELSAVEDDTFEEDGKTISVRWDDASREGVPGKLVTLEVEYTDAGNRDQMVVLTSFRYYKEE